MTVGLVRWEGDTLVVDTVGFNEKTWLLGREGKEEYFFCQDNERDSHQVLGTESLVK
jgi:hypothetical protein